MSSTTNWNCFNHFPHLFHVNAIRLMTREWRRVSFHTSAFLSTFPFLNTSPWLPLIFFKMRRERTEERGRRMQELSKFNWEKALDLNGDDLSIHSISMVTANSKAKTWPHGHTHTDCFYQFPLFTRTTGLFVKTPIWTASFFTHSIPSVFLHFTIAFILRSQKVAVTTLLQSMVTQIILINIAMSTHQNPPLNCLSLSVPRYQSSCSCFPHDNYGIMSCDVINKPWT